MYVFNFLSYDGDMTIRLIFFCTRTKVSKRIVILCNNENDDDNRQMAYLYFATIYLQRLGMFNLRVIT